MKRRQFVMGCSAAMVASCAPPVSDAPVRGGTPLTGPDVWPAWPVFQAQFVSEGGRVVDNSDGKAQTVSEGQAYALFFALVANDREGFERLLRWTEDNLCQGDMSAHLPAWLWGQQRSGAWGVIDPNPASDADLWLAYALAEAGRLWGVDRYSALAHLVSARVLRTACADLPGLGLCLLPGPQGFALGQGRWRLNASYSPPHLLQWLAQYSEQNDWKHVAATTARVIEGSAPRGWVADWVLYDADKGFLADTEGPDKAHGAYNAIRVYMWVGMMHPAMPERQRLLQALAPMAQWVAKEGFPPESIHALTGEYRRAGPAGFSSALLPFLQAQQDAATLHAQRQRVTAKPVRPDAYYEQALTLFSQGFMSGAYRFAANGQLQPRWGGV